MTSFKPKKNINIASYSTNCVGIVVWTVDMIILMSYKKKMKRQMLQACLMLLYHASWIVTNQTTTLYVRHFFDDQPPWYSNRRCTTIDGIATFFTISSFVVAHWLFAFDYLRLAYKTKLKNENKPAHTNKYVLSAINYTTSCVIILLTASFVFTIFYGTIK